MSEFNFSTVIDILREANELGVKILYENDELSIKVPKGEKLNESFIQRLKAEQSLLKRYFQEYTTEKPVPEITEVINSGGYNPSQAPLSFAQERIWFIDQLEGSSQYHVSSVFKLNGKVSYEYLEKSFKVLLDRQRALRTYLIVNDETAYQATQPSDTWSINLHQGQQFDEQKLKQEIERLKKQPFDLTRDFMLRVDLLERTGSEVYLIMTVHHIACDGMSMAILFREFQEIYNAIVLNKTVRLPELTVQYADYAFWQRKTFDEGYFDKKIAYWKRQLSESKPLNLPLDFDRTKAALNPKGDSYQFELEKETTDKVKSLIATHQGVTLFSFLLAVYNVVLARWSRQSDVIVGSPVVNRQREGLQNVVGLFLNTLALRNKPGYDKPFMQFLHEVRDNTVEAFQNQDYQFENLLGQLNIKRDLNRNPLFDVFFNLINFKQDTYGHLEGIEINSYQDNDLLTAKFDLNLYAREYEGKLYLNCVYNGGLFKRQTIEYVFSQFAQLVNQIASSPETHIGEFDIFSQSALPEVTNSVQVKKSFDPFEEIDQTIHGRFSEIAGKYGDHIAICTQEDAISYKELDRLSHQLADGLVQDDQVPAALLFDHGANMIVGMLGVLKAGRPYVPIDTSYPVDRIIEILDDSKADVIVTNGENEALAQEVISQMDRSIRVINLDKLPAPISSHAQDVEVKPTDLAYILYTSGSTGKPKGVMQSHCNTLHFCRTYTNALHISPDDKLTGLSNYCSDASKMSIYGALLNGATLFPFDIRNDDFSRFSELIDQHGITIYHSTPSVYRFFTDTLKAKPSCTSLRLVVLGGEPVLVEDVERYKSYFSDSCLMINGLGPTESTLALQYFIDKNTKTGKGYVPVGYPVAHTRVDIRRPDLELADVYEEGELVFHSKYLALGYWGDLEKTAKAFLEPEGKSAVRSYRSGDMGRVLPDGTIEFIGRADNQVKLRGYRVELGEVENAIAQISGVEKCSVILKDLHGEPHLVAYHVSKSGITSDQIRNNLAKRLPGYMIPTAYVSMADIPLNANGKLDRSKLPEPESTIESERYVTPAGETELKLLKIWAELLRQDANLISAESNFFDLGGHSLIATKMVSAIRKGVSSHITIRDIFLYPTISQLAEYIDNSESQRYTQVLRKQNNKGPVPLSFEQEGLWFIHNLQGSLHYHMPWVFKLTGKVDTTILEESFRHVIERHQVLRTCIAHHDGQGVQEVLPSEQWHISHMEERDIVLSGDTLESYTQEFISRPFDMENDFMVKASLVRKNENEHTLILLIHHIAFDAWSLPIMVSELSELYNAITSGRKPSLKELPVQYSDYALWQRTHLTPEVLEKRMSFWAEKLSGVQPLSLAPDFRRDTASGVNGAVHSRKINTEIYNELKEVSSARGVTLFMTLLSVYKVLLYKFTGTTDLCIGTPLAGRQSPELELLIGYFVNTLPLRTQIDGDSTFAQLLKEVKDSVLEVYENQDVPFDQILKNIEAERDQGRSSVFQVTFALQNAVRAGSEQFGDELKLTSVGTTRHTAKFDFSLNIVEYNDGLQLNLNYRSDLYSAHTANQLLVHYEVLLQSLLKAMDTPLKRVSSLPESEKTKIASFSGNYAVLNQDDTILTKFQEQVDSVPNHVAVIFEGSQLTYTDLDTQSDRVAGWLRSLGIGRETIVPVCMDRTHQMIVAYLGILKAGGAYLPLDPKYPQERISLMLADAASNHVIVDRKYIDKVNSLSVKPLVLDDLEIGKHQGSEVDYAKVSFSSLANVIYTSGSTGRPKGVMVEHGNIVSLVKAVEYVTLTPDDRLLATGSPSFDASTFEYWSMLLNGGTLVLGKEDELLDTDKLRSLVRRNKITQMWFTSGWFNELVETDITIFESLNAILVGGEKLSETHVFKVKEQFPHLQIINGYGPTENTTFSLTHNISIDKRAASIPIGRPLNNRTAHILDAHRNLVPIGGVGELFLGGAGLSREYLKAPETTNDKYFAYILDNGETTRIYKTGDLARWLPDGAVQYMGRNDHQVKIRGHRIEPGEIESIILQSGLVKQCVVAVLENNNESKKLVGYVVLSEGAAVDEVWDLVKGNLPEYMVPQNLFELASMPLTSNGKVDKRALQDSVTQTDAEFVAPKDDLEAGIAEIWKDLLGVEEVSAHDDFFDLGGHSLLATRVVSAIRKTLSIKVPIGDVFEYPRLNDLAEHLRSLEKGDTDEVSVPQKIDGPVPLSFAQERLWFIDRLQGSVDYHMPWVFQVKGQLDTDVLQKAFVSIIERHNVLRTVIKEEEGIGYQYTKEASGWSINKVDESELNGQDKDAYINSLIKAPFDLTKDYTLKVTLIRSSEQNHTLLLLLHHIAFDGWSISIMVNELVEIYNSLKKGQKPELKPLPCTYAHYALWQRSHLSGDNLKAKMGYWKSKLEDVSTLHLPTDFERSRHHGAIGAVASKKLPLQILKGLNEISKQHDATLFMSLLAAFKVLLYKYTNQTDICVGTPIAGRLQQEFEELIGFFVNTLPLRTQIAEEHSFSEFLQQVRRTTLEAYENQEVPFEKIVDALEVERDINQNAIFQVMFSLQNTPQAEAIALEGLTLERAGTDRSRAKFDLNLVVNEGDDGLQLGMVYRKDLFTGDTINQLLNHYEKLLYDIVTQCNTPVRQAELLSDEEKSTLISGFNNTDSSVDYETVVEAFRLTTTHEPHNIAVVGNDKHTITYQQLDERSDQVAHYLTESGLKQGSVVAVYFEKSIDMIAAILGVIKSGCIYLPLSSKYPKQRIQYILQDSGAVGIISNKQSNEGLDIDGAKVILLDDIVSSTGMGASMPVKIKIRPEQPVYITYTSGSTGQPKGVTIEHGSLSNYISHQVKYYGLESQERILQFSDPTFDASIEQIFIAFTSGSALVLLPEEDRLNSLKFKSFLRQHSITHLHTTPSYLKTISPDNYDSLRRVIVGGELCEYDLAKAWSRYCRFFNKYGPTETTITVCAYEFKSDLSPRLKSVPIGKPVPNTQFYVLDDRMELVPVGVSGQLYIGGKQLAKGYLNRDELNNEKFVQNPFDKIKNSKLYATGDIVKWLPDGNLIFIGRDDDQVKVRGLRIELGEIEYHLGQHTQIKHCKVLITGHHGEKIITAYYVSGSELMPVDIRSFLLERLPAYMLPSSYVHLGQMPLTQTGKIDTKALISVSIVNAEGQQQPIDDLERQLVAVWAEVLKVDPKKISTDQSFFELGGHSLKMMVMVNAIQKLLQVDVPLVEIFKRQDIRGISQYIRESEGRIYKPIPALERQPYYKLSSAQQRMYFLQQFDKSAVTYNMPQMYRLQGELDRARMEQAFQALISRHDAFRTSFVEVDEEIVQQVHDSVDLNIKYKTCLYDEAAGAIKGFIRPFDLSERSLLKVGLVSFTDRDNEHLLMVDIHHIISDGISQKILLRDFVSLYNGEDLPGVKLTYKDYAEWRQQKEQKVSQAAQQEFWLNIFSDEVPVLELPADHQRPKYKSSRGGVVGFNLSEEATHKLREISQSEGSTMFMTLLSTYYVLLSKLSNQEDLVVGTPVAGREHADIEQVVGLFVNTLPLRSFPKRELTYRDFLSEMRDQVVSYFDNQQYPYEELVDKLRIERDPGRNPLFEVMFSYQSFEQTEVEMSGIKIGPFRAGNPLAKFDLNLSATESDDQINLNFIYNADLFEEDTVGRFAKYMKSIIEVICSNPEIRLGNIDFMEQAEQDQLLNEFSGIQQKPAAKLIFNHVIEAFLARVQEAPDSIALVYDNSRMTYRQLDERSSQVAYTLSELGIEPGTIVPICHEKNMDMIVAMLGVLKAGCAYLPVSPMYPASRIEYIITDVQAKYVIGGGDLAGFEGSGIEIIQMNNLADQSALVDFKGVEISASQTAYVLYTSGSTGQPKGVVIAHDSLNKFIESQVKAYPLEEGEKILQFSDFTFDASVEQIFMAITTGATLVLLPDQYRLDHELFESYLQSNEITHMHTTPSFLKTITPGAHGSLKRVVVGGEVCDYHLADEWSKHCRFFNTYGPTEATVTVSMFEFKRGDNQELKSVPIGKPVANAQLYILNDDLKPVPVGVAGELYVGGDQLAVGYLNNKTLTAEKFLTNTLSAQGGRLYKTGDITKWLPDGNILFMGRNDDQVKIRGLRIELGEIEYCLGEHSDIINTKIILADHHGEKVLVAYYTARQEVSTADIREFLLASLPVYMLPSYYVYLEEMPLTQTGKIDKKALPHPEFAISGDIEEASNHIEESLITIWSGLLGLPEHKISVTRSFFELGGHSLLATMMVNKVYRELKVQVPVREVFNKQTIKDLSDYIITANQIEIHSESQDDIIEFTL
ncbi:amino acid adenylation domain-containing protein [Fulvivirga ulvae]|uniref:non-ribosomal peptide synthetase n=1 Tax=Fulvivirga ulvae TaxID=2904245 RepID=UPI001F44CDF0|nr:non-ribosomal peptide synthetase [Fulvivirga ulvae]UII31886.1 amino acid adenylation domain-containing protein [Fulvivirga ulvae]